MSLKITIICDTCGEVKEETSHRTGSRISIKETDYYQVIFTTDQDEGRSVKPYLTREQVDICDSCLKKILSGYILIGSGAQGYNKYTLETPNLTNGDNTQKENE